MLTNSTDTPNITRNQNQIQAVIADLLGVNPESTLVLKLAERRISPEVIATYRLQARGTGWTYPTPAGALRFKNADSAAPNKYAWIGELRDQLLFPEEITEAIQLAGHDVWLTTEFDFFAMQSAGIYHTIGQLAGETTVPRDLAPLLQILGVLNVHIAPDRDKQGQAWSQLVANALNPYGIEVTAHELPFPLTEKHGADIGDLWKGYTRPQPFERYLFSLPAAQIKAVYPEGEGITQAPIAYAIPSEIKDAIRQALGVRKFNAKGYSQPLLCLFHDDHKPSAALHIEWGLKCHTCGKWYRWKDLAERLGFAWNIAKPGEQGIGLGDELIQAMIARGASTLAYVLETAYRAGWKAGDAFTISDLTRLGIPGKRARKAFEQMDGKGFDVRKQKKTKKGTFCPESSSFLFIPKEGTKKGRKVGHRPAKTRQLPDPADLAKLYRVTVTKHSRISLKGKLADFRAEVYAAPIDRDPGTYPRQELCKPLNIAVSTARTYDRRAGVTVIPNQERAPIASPDILPETPELKATWLETADGRRFSATKAGFEFATRHAAGGKVWKVKQLANEYRRK